MSVRRIRVEGVKRNRKGGAVFSNNFLTLPTTPSSHDAPISIPFTSIPIRPISSHDASSGYDTKRNVGSSSSAVSHIPGVNYPSSNMTPMEGIHDETDESSGATISPPVRPAARPKFVGTDATTVQSTELTGSTPLDNAGFGNKDSSVELSGQDDYFKKHVQPISEERLPAAFLTEILKGRNYLKHVSDEVREQQKPEEPKTGIPLLMEEIRRGISLRPITSVPERAESPPPPSPIERDPPPLPPRLPPPPPPPAPKPLKKRAKLSPKPKPRPTALLQEIQRGYKLKPIKKPTTTTNPRAKETKKSLQDMLKLALQAKFKKALTSADDSDGDEW